MTSSIKGSYSAVVISIYLNIGQMSSPLIIHSIIISLLIREFLGIVHVACFWGGFFKSISNSIFSLLSLLRSFEIVDWVKENI